MQRSRVSSPEKGCCNVSSEVVPDSKKHAKKVPATLYTILVPMTVLMFSRYHGF